jgi:pimeloyl-ACP methyl ester carboxylesterase
MTERMVETDGVELCTEPFGDPDAPPVLLLMGIGGSMLWWDEAFCRMLADRGRFVIRYDLRDAGRSVTYEPGRPGYTGQDLVRDVVGVLDGYDLPSAHLVGLSAGGGIAQEVALCFPDRVRSLVLLGTSPVTAVDRRLPPPSDAYLRFVREVEVDWSSPASVVEYQVAYSRVLAGAVRPFDERAAPRTTTSWPRPTPASMRRCRRSPSPRWCSTAARTRRSHRTTAERWPRRSPALSSSSSTAPGTASSDPTGTSSPPPSPSTPNPPAPPDPASP